MPFRPAPTSERQGQQALEVYVRAFAAVQVFRSSRPADKRGEAPGCPPAAPASGSHGRSKLPQILRRGNTGGGAEAFADACPFRQVRGALEPEGRLDVGVAVPGKDGPALLLKGLADDLERKDVELPAGGQTGLGQGQILRTDGCARGGVHQAPARMHRLPERPAKPNSPDALRRASSRRSLHALSRCGADPPLSCRGRRCSPEVSSTWTK